MPSTNQTEHNHAFENERLRARIAELEHELARRSSPDPSRPLPSPGTVRSDITAQAGHPAGGEAPGGNGNSHPHRDGTNCCHEARLIRLTEDMNAIVFSVSLPGGHFEYLSNAIERISGYRAQEFYDDPGLLFRMTHPDSLQGVQTEWNRMLAGSPPLHYEFKAITKDGVTKWIELRNVLVTAEDGTPVAFEGIVIDITERKHAEEALRQSEERLRMLAGNMRDVIFRKKIPGGEIEYINNAVERITGYPPGEFYRDPTFLAKLLPPELREEFHHDWTEIVQGRIKPAYTFRLITRAGAVRWMEQRNVLIRDDHGAPVAIEGIVTDITEHMEAQRALRESEERLRMLTQNMRDVIFRLSLPDGRHEYLNSSAERLTGYPLETFYATPLFIREIIHPDHQDFFDTHWPKILAGTINPTTEYKIVTATGAVKWVEQRNVLIHDEEGAPIALEGTVSDITKRKTAEEALRASEHYLATTLNSIGDAVIATDCEGLVTRMNPIAQHLTGWTIHDAEGLPLTDVLTLVNGRTGEPAENPARRVLSEGRIVGLANHTTLVSRTGETYQIADSAAPIVSGDGAFTGVVMVFRDITESYHRQQALRESEERNRAISELTSDYVYSITADEIAPTTEWISGAFTHITGFEAGEFISGVRDWHSLMHPDDRETASRAFTPLRQGHQVTIEYRIVDAIGSTRWIRDHARPVLDKAGRLIRILGAVKDITLDKEVDRSLRFLGSITEQISDTIFITDTNGRIIYINSATERTFGYSADELIGNPPIMLNADPDDKTLMSDIRQTITAGETWRGELLNSRKDGSTFVSDVQVSPMSGDDGQVIGYICIQRDITARKQTEETLRETSTLLAALFDAIPDSISLIDRDYRLIRANETILRRQSLSAADIEGLHCYELWGLTEPCKGCQTAEVFAAGTPARTERYDRNLRAWMDVRAYPIFGGDGEVTGVIEHFRDITEEKRAERRRKKLEEQLAHAQKMESVGRLAGGIAHDFNNMLTVIIGNADLAMAATGEGGLVHDEVREIKIIADRASHLTRQLLAFSRRQIVKPRNIVLNEVIITMDHMLRRLIGEDIELSTVMASDLWTARIDPGQVEQLITNIAVNARDAMPEGGKLVIETANVYLDEDFADTHPSVIPGDHVMLRMTDTGTGMDEKILDNIFEPFFTTKDKSKGTGLGMSTCYGIVKQNEGSIWVTSEPGTGTTVTIYLPRSSGKASDVQTTMPVVVSDRGHETIVVAEDEPALLKMVTRVLEDSGYTVLSAANGEEALRLIDHYHHDIHLVLTDMIMPRMGGRELTDAIRESHSTLPIVFMSGYTDQSVIEHEGSVFIQKPFTAPALLKYIRQALNDAR